MPAAITAKNRNQKRWVSGLAEEQTDTLKKVQEKLMLEFRWWVYSVYCKILSVKKNYVCLKFFLVCWRKYKLSLKAQLMLWQFGEGFLGFLNYLWPVPHACYQNLFFGNSCHLTCRTDLFFYLSLVLGSELLVGRQAVFSLYF